MLPLWLTPMDVKRLRIKERAQRQALELAPSLFWAEIVFAMEQALGETWDDFGERYGDWARDAAPWFGRRWGRLPLATLGELAGGWTTLR